MPPPLPDPALVRQYYEQLIGPLRATARECGYALAVHGSLARDIDLLAVPWTEDAVPARALVIAVHNCLKRTLDNPHYLHHPCHHLRHEYQKPHGRRAWTFMLCFEGVYIDLSVVPLVKNS